MPLTPTVSQRPSPTEIQSVLRLGRILRRWGLEQKPWLEAVAHMRTLYMQQGRCLRAYVVAMLGREVALCSVSEFHILAGGIMHEPKGEARLVDYIVEHFAQNSWPAYLELRQRGEGGENIFFL